MKNIPSFHEHDFKQSSFCTIPGHCVQVAYKSGIIAVRDSKNPQQNLLCFDENEWMVFLTGVKNGEFDF